MYSFLIWKLSKTIFLVLASLPCRFATGQRKVMEFYIWAGKLVLKAREMLGEFSYLDESQRYPWTCLCLFRWRCLRAHVLSKTSNTKHRIVQEFAAPEMKIGLESSETALESNAVTKCHFNMN